MSRSFEESLKRRALRDGFQAVAIAPARLPRGIGEKLEEYLAVGRHGDMDWLREKSSRRASPDSLWPEARSAIVLGLNYGPADDPLAGLAHARSGNISVYARGGDYHDLIKGKLKQLAHWLARSARADVKVFVDTAPIMEKPLAETAGLGWQGKHTNLVSRDFGSWLFLGVILTDAALAPDAPESDRCGNCRACLDVCPTRAFPAPYQLDARRCISYLTIEHKGHIAPEFRPAIGNRVFGCDDCLAVCPWNKFAVAGRESRLAARDDLTMPALDELAALDDAAFRRRFAGTSIKRTGRDRFLRNVLIAIGNSAARELVPAAERNLGDPSPLVRAMAVWALSRLLDRHEFARERDRRYPAEADGAVRAEWTAAS
jgi:epoxyqueuosine reductase